MALTRERFYPYRTIVDIEAERQQKEVEERRARHQELMDDIANAQAAAAIMSEAFSSLRSAASQAGDAFISWGRVVNTTNVS